VAADLELSDGGRLAFDTVVCLWWGARKGPSIKDLPGPPDIDRDGYAS
jgi:hypothetical protein